MLVGLGAPFADRVAARREARGPRRRLGAPAGRTGPAHLRLADAAATGVHGAVHPAEQPAQPPLHVRVHRWHRLRVLHQQLCAAQPRTPGLRRQLPGAGRGSGVGGDAFRALRSHARRPAPVHRGADDPVRPGAETHLRLFIPPSATRQRPGPRALRVRWTAASKPPGRPRPTCPALPGLLWTVALDGAPVPLDDFVASERQDLGMRGLTGYRSGLRPGLHRWNWRGTPRAATRATGGARTASRSGSRPASTSRTPPLSRRGA